MNVLETIKFSENPERLDELYIKMGIPLDSDPEDLGIYCLNTLDLSSEICILNSEESNEELIFDRNGIKYILYFL
ncbi:hypothetical protein [Sphingobacterium sp.]|uniref:hypothetical protein n=1 Tax=Sphingobacterium sp. TaxID=341027 RepID=UPI0031E116BF